MYSKVIEAPLLVLAPRISSYITSTNSLTFRVTYQERHDLRKSSPNVVWKVSRAGPVAKYMIVMLDPKDNGRK